MRSVFGLVSLAVFACLYPSGLALAGQHSWTTTGPVGVAASIVVLDPSFPSRLYSLATVYSVDGLTSSAFKSASDGRAWEEIARTPANFLITALVVDSADPSRLYAATVALDGPRRPIPPGNVYRSNNQGLTWILTKTFSDDVILMLAIDPRVPEFLYAGGWTNPCGSMPCYRGVLYGSSDSAVSWTEIDRGLSSPVGQLVVDPIRPGVLFAATVGGLFRSNDNGLTWALFSTGLEKCSLIVEAIAVDPRDSDVLFAAVSRGAYNDLGCKAVFKSTDGGASWNTTSLRGPHVGSLAIDPARPGIVYASAVSGPQLFSPPPGVFRTSDGGATWSPFITGLPPRLGINGLAIDPSGLLIHAATNSGVFEYQLGVVPRSVPFR